MLDLCEQLATRYFAPHNKKSDAQEPTFDGTRVTVIDEVKEALDAFAKADLIGMSADEASAVRSCRCAWRRPASHGSPPPTSARRAI